jgi:hypothetical protein
MQYRDRNRGTQDPTGLGASSGISSGTQKLSIQFFKAFQVFSHIIAKAI